jgi:hypothetical protein
MGKLLRWNVYLEEICQHLKLGVEYSTKPYAGTLVCTLEAEQKTTPWSPSSPFAVNPTESDFRRCTPYCQVLSLIHLDVLKVACGTIADRKFDCWNRNWRRECEDCVSILVHNSKNAPSSQLHVALV